MLKKEIFSKLKNVLDPELNISIVDLGLVYDVKMRNGSVEIVMTLTTMGCPLFSLIEEEVKKEIQKIKGVKAVNVELTFDPPWNIDKMSKKAKSLLGF